MEEIDETSSGEITVRPATSKFPKIVPAALENLCIIVLVGQLRKRVRAREHIQT